MTPRDTFKLGRRVEWARLGLINSETRARAEAILADLRKQNPDFAGLIDEATASAQAVRGHLIAQTLRDMTPANRIPA